MANEYISLYRRTLARRQTLYDASISSGEFTGFLYPWDTLPALYLFLAVTVTPRLPLKQARIVRLLAFFLILLHGGYVVSHRRTLWFAGGYGIGLSSAWGMVMSGAVLVCNDIEHDFQRLETRPASQGNASAALTNGHTAASTSAESANGVDLSNRKVRSVYTKTDTKQNASHGAEQPASRPYRLVWQGFPYDGGWLHLIDWTADLMTSFRGVGWKHRISTVGPMDIPQLPENSKDESKGKVNQEHTATSVSVQNLHSLQLRAMQDCAFYYLLLDFLKTTMITDPYFLGLVAVDSPTPWSWLARVNQVMPIAVRVVRLSMAMTGVIAALTAIFSISPLFFATILPKLLDITKITKAPLLEPALYPPMWYPLGTSVLRSGLAGFWGKFWHQMFRFGISEPSRVLIERLKLNPRGVGARIIQLLVAFGISGSIHALGSYTSFSAQGSRPLSGPLLFFLLQGVGTFLQSSVVQLLKRSSSGSKTEPTIMGKTANMMFVVTWLYFTGPLLSDDFARCGIWLFEPVPISPLRALGFGPGGKDEGWWTWYQEGARWYGWRRGENWWDTGVVIY